MSTKFGLDLNTLISDFKYNADRNTFVLELASCSVVSSTINSVTLQISQPQATKTVKIAGKLVLKNANNCVTVEIESHKAFQGVAPAPVINTQPKAEPVVASNVLDFDNFGNFDTGTDALPDFNQATGATNNDTSWDTGWNNNATAEPVRPVQVVIVAPTFIENKKFNENISWDQPLPDAHGTCPSEPNYNEQKALEDATILRTAMKGVGCDTKKIVSVVGARNHAQRLLIKDVYDRTMFKGDKKKRQLIKDLKSELSGNTSKLVIPLFMDRGEFDAQLIKKAADGVGFDADLFIDVVCTRTNQQIVDMKQAWTHSIKSKKSLQERVRSETKKMIGANSFQELMLTILKAERPSNSKTAISSEVERDAEILNRFTSQNKKSEIKEKFIDIFTRRSFSHIGKLAGAFQNITKKFTLSGIIKDIFGNGSNTAKALQTILAFCSQPYDYWAVKLKKSMKGLGTDDSGLIRIIVTRCELDLQNISHVFGQRHGDGKTLKNWIDGDTKGNYNKLINMLCGYYSDSAPADFGADFSFGTASDNFGMAAGGWNDWNIDDAKKNDNDNVNQSDVSFGDGKWEQPMPGAQGSCPVMQGFDDNQALTDAKAIRAAMKGLTCDTKKVVAIIGARNQAQRLLIRDKYESTVLPGEKDKRHMLKDLKSKLSGKVKKLGIALFLDRGQFDAQTLKYAADGMGFNEDLFIEIICTRTNQQILDMKQAWQQSVKSKKSLQERIESETKNMIGSNSFRELLCTILKGERPPNVKKNINEEVLRDAEVLNRFTTQNKKAEIKDKFIEIFTRRSFSHIGKLTGAYQTVSKKFTLDGVIKDTFSGGSNTAKALQTILSFCSQPYDYWAKKLLVAMKGLGTDDTGLIRIVISRCEIDLKDIANVFGQRYGNGKTMKNWIDDDTSGEYRKLLNMLCGFEF